MRILVTGTAGFIGFHLARRLLADGHQVVGYDAMTPYYDVSLKEARNKLLSQFANFRSVIGYLEDMPLLSATAAAIDPEVVIHLAGQAGVRYSLEAPRAYVDSNLVGSFNVMEIARAHQVRHLLMASTSSVYGLNKKMPFAELDKADHPITLYAATKRAMETMGHSYAHLWGIPTTCFRFFTVYGPWGRPDMALFKFVSAIRKGQPIDVYGGGDMKRDFTYIDDLVEGIVRLIACAPIAGLESGAESLSPVAPWRIVNIGNGNPVGLMDFVAAIEKATESVAIKNYLPMQKGDVVATYADNQLLQSLTGFKPQIGVEEGVKEFVNWYDSYYKADSV